MTIWAGTIKVRTAQATPNIGHNTGQNYTGHDYIGDGYMGRNFIGQNYMGHNYMRPSHIGHCYVDCVRHDYMGHTHAVQDYIGINVCYIGSVYRRRRRHVDMPSAMPI